MSLMKNEQKHWKSILLFNFMYKCTYKYIDILYYNTKDSNIFSHSINACAIVFWFKFSVWEHSVSDMHRIVLTNSWLTATSVLYSSGQRRKFFIQYQQYNESVIQVV